MSRRVGEAINGLCRRGRGQCQSYSNRAPREVNAQLAVATSAPPLPIRLGSVRRGLACASSVCCNLLSCSAVSFWLDSLSPPLRSPHRNINTSSILPQRHPPSTAMPRVSYSACQQQLRGKLSRATPTKSWLWWRLHACAKRNQPAAH